MLIRKYRVDNIVEATITRETGEGLAVPTKNGFPTRDLPYAGSFLSSHPMNGMGLQKGFL